MDVLPLLKVLADGRFHSGQELGAALNVSRTAVWKQMNVLKGLGLEIHSVTGRGYRLAQEIDLLDRERILAEMPLGRQMLGEHFDLQFSVGSTNQEAMLRAQQGLERYLLIAEHQSAGRGRRGRPWVSPLGHNIYLSAVWSFNSGVAALEGLSLVCALVVVRALRACAYEGVGVKWPNDVLLAKKKLAGILLEVHGDMSGPCKLIIGIGVNTAMPAAAARAIDQPFSDLASVSARQKVDRNQIAAAVVEQLVLALQQFDREGFAPFRGEWQGLDVYAQQEVEIRSGAQVLTGVVQGVDEAGRLLLQTASGPERVYGGEVFPSLRPVPAEQAQES